MMIYKYLILIIFILTPSLSQAQEGDNTYRLLKNGKEYQRPTVYILEDSFGRINKEGEKIRFLTEWDQFVHNPDIHSAIKLDKLEFDTLNLRTPYLLYKLEESEYKEKSKLILEETGVKPIPPVSHSILQIFIIRKENSDYSAYEVKWL